MIILYEISYDLAWEEHKQLIAGSLIYNNAVCAIGPSVNMTM